MVDVIESVRRSSAGVAVTDAAKWGLRRVGTATSSMRAAPDFVIIGSKRGGTTSLWAYLQEHPGILELFPSPENIKGTYFFDEGWGNGERWYLSHFPTAATRRTAERRLGHRTAVGEASPYYLFHPLAPARCRQIAPEALIIAVLRDPVERAFSHWKERRNHTESLDFMDALEAESERTAGEEERIIADPSYVSFAHRHQTYLAQSKYASMLERWSSEFPADQMIVEAAETMYADPQRFVDRITDRLGLPQRELANVSPFNAEPSTAMPAEARSFLEERLEGEVAAIEEMLGTPMPWGVSRSD